MSFFFYFNWEITRYFQQAQLVRCIKESITLWEWWVLSEQKHQMRFHRSVGAAVSPHPELLFAAQSVTWFLTGRDFSSRENGRHKVLIVSLPSSVPSAWREEKRQSGKRKRWRWKGKAGREKVERGKAERRVITRMRGERGGRGGDIWGEDERREKGRLTDEKQRTFICVAPFNKTAIQRGLCKKGWEKGEIKLTQQDGTDSRCRCQLFPEFPPFSWKKPWTCKCFRHVYISIASQFIKKHNNKETDVFSLSVRLVSCFITDAGPKMKVQTISSSA